MKTILSLQGIGGSGKTTTITKLWEKLKRLRFISIYPNFKKNYDFLDILKYKKIIVGVTTQGDNYSIIKQKLKIMKKYNCNIMICACRTYGSTIDPIMEHKKTERRFIPKNVGRTKKQQNAANDSDAKYMLNAIKQII